jgi:hypothetical protein
MNQYQNQANQPQPQQQHQFQQNHQQYPSLQHPSHQSGFNYHHHMFNRMQSQPPQQQQNQHSVVPKTEMPPTDDPYRFVEDELSNNLANMPPQHIPPQQGAMHPHHTPHHMAPNYNPAASSPMSMGPGPGGHMNHNQMNMAGSPQTGNFN